MRIASLAARALDVPLTRPYTISSGSSDSVSMALFELTDDDGQRGFGQASPAPDVTGETRAASLAALEPAATGWLIGRDPSDPTLLDELAARCRGPAARAAIDMALCDLTARAAGQPWVQQLGRVHHELPTSITIGQKPVAETLTEADEYRARGFSVLKVKIGRDVGEDIERLRQLRRRFGAAVTLRVDANRGYDERALRQLVAQMQTLDLEVVEQPLPPGSEDILRRLPPAVQRRLAADESVRDAADLERLLEGGCPYGIVNVKLMKCGGPRAALQLAHLCAQHDREVMWGCNDESVLGIAAALHAAFAAPATRYLDLDGSLDLATDPFTGGFALTAGRMSTLARPGLGALPT